jgi:hypothetical protein
MVQPGSSGAKMLGCLCDEVCNNYGTGTGIGDMYGRRFIVSESCNLHGNSRWGVHVGPGYDHSQQNDNPKPTTPMPFDRVLKI